MVPNKRPYVPVFNSCKMPKADMPENEKGRLCSIYFRPWTLCSDLEVVPHVPHMLHLTMYPKPAVRHRKRSKGKAAAEETEASWANSWARYIRGNVVSDHAARIIRRFLSLTLARRCGDNAHDSDDDATSQIDEVEGHCAEAVKLDLDEAHRILQVKEESEEMNAAGEKVDKDKAKQSRGSKKSDSHWPLKPNAGDGPWDSSGNMETNAVEEYKKAAKASERKSDNKATSSNYLFECALMQVSSSEHEDAKELGSRMLTYNKHSKDKHKHQAKQKCDFMRKARAEIFSRGHVGDIRKWMEELQVVFALLRA